MIYNLEKVSAAYVRGFLEFLRTKRLVIDDVYAYGDLFSYSLKVLYDLPAFEQNFYIDRYSADCVKYLRRVKRVPKTASKLDVEDRMNIVIISKSYLIAGCLLSTERSDR